MPEEPLKLEDLDDITLRSSEAFLAMGKFLHAFAERWRRPEAALATLCTDIEVEDDGTSTDPAAISDWAACVEAVLRDTKH